MVNVAITGYEIQAAETVVLKYGDNKQSIFFNANSGLHP